MLENSTKTRLKKALWYKHMYFNLTSFTRTHGQRISLKRCKKYKIRQQVQQTEKENNTDIRLKRIGWKKTWEKKKNEVIIRVKGFRLFLVTEDFTEPLRETWARIKTCPSPVCIENNLPCTKSLPRNVPALEYELLMHIQMLLFYSYPLKRSVRSN